MIINNVIFNYYLKEEKTKEVKKDEKIVKHNFEKEDFSYI
jgi:hypothetical protein